MIAPNLRHSHGQSTNPAGIQPESNAVEGGPERDESLQYFQAEIVTDFFPITPCFIPHVDPLPALQDYPRGRVDVKTALRLETLEQVDEPSTGLDGFKGKAAAGDDCWPSETECMSV